MLSGAIVRVSGMVIIVHTPPTKSGKRVMFLTLEDETGLFDVVVFSKMGRRN
jgi:DNA polymerase III alpha subunit